MNYETASVCSVRAKKTFAGPGVYGFDAEAEVCDHIGETVYVHVNAYYGRHYSVSEKSVYDFMAGEDGEPVEEFLEEYDKLQDAKSSVYYKTFDMLNKVITRMEKGL